MVIPFQVVAVDGFYTNSEDGSHRSALWFDTTIDYQKCAGPESPMVPAVAQRVQAIPVEIQWLLGLSQTAQTLAAGYAAFVSPDVGPSLHELINVELQRLRRSSISAIKIRHP